MFYVTVINYLAILKQLGHQTLPDDLTCTSMTQRSSVPRGKKLNQSKFKMCL